MVRSQKGDWLIQWKTPIAYVERNFQLDEQEKAQLSQEFQLFGIDNDVPPPDANTTLAQIQQMEFDKFSKKHLISDKVGVGDSRMTAGYMFIEKPTMWLNAGFLSTIPTAFAFKKGVWKGSHFEKNSNNPPFNLLEILTLVLGDPAEVAQAQKLIVDFLLGALDKLSANLLDAEIGNGGHVGVGLFFDNKLYVTPRFSFISHGEFEYLLPAYEKRFYINKKDQNAFTQIAQNPADCVPDINFIQTQLIQTLYPRVFSTLVFPGVLLKFSTAADILVSPVSHLNIGYDLWWTQHEHFGRIIATTQEEALIRKNLALKPSAFQSKIFGAFTYEHSGTHGEWCISVTGDYTFLAAGIGKDVSASLRLEYLF